MAANVDININAHDNFSGTLGNFGNIVTGIKSAIDLAGEAFSAFTGFAMQGLDAIANYERMSASFETLTAKELLASGAADTMTQALSMSGEKAEELLQWNQQLAINSPFTAEGVANALRMAMAYGFTVDEAKRLTEALIDFAAGTGATEASMEAIARALGQISATGKVTGGDMLQLVNAGLPVAQILAEGFGKTTAEIMAMREKGLLPAKESIEMITTYLETNFQGAAERMANTWAGLQGTFADLKVMGLRELFTGMFDALQPLAISLSQWLQGPGMDKLHEWGTTLGEVTANFVTFIQKVATLGEAIKDGGFDSTQAKAFIYNLTGVANPENFVDFADKFVSNAIDSLTNRIVLWMATGGPEELGKKFSEWVDKLGTGTDFESQTAMAAIRFFMKIDEAFGKIDWSGMMADVDKKIAESLSGVNWQESGTAIANGLAGGIKTTMGQPSFWSNLFSNQTMSVMPGMAILNWIANSESATQLGAGILNWIGGVFIGIGEHIISPETVRSWNDSFNTFFTVTLPASIRSFNDEFNQIGKDIWAGIVEGLNDFEFNTWEWINIHLTLPVKRALGISSPSTVFFGIGKDIIQGLIDGVQSLTDPIFAAFKGIMDRIINSPAFKLVARVLGIEITSGGQTGDIGGGTTGGMAGDTSHTRGGLPTDTTLGGLGGVTNIFYGPVYFGDMSSLGYDCPSPHPLMTASSQSLLASSTFTP